MDEPLPVLPLDYAGAGARSQKPRRFTLMMALITWLICVGGTIAVWLSTESVLATGPALLSTALIMTIGTIKPFDPVGFTIGGSHIAVCFTFVILVNAFHWSPRDAQLPFNVLAPIYTVVMTFPSAVLFRRWWRL